MTEDELKQQVRVRLAGLAGSGVEWLPRVGTPRPTAPQEAPGATPQAADPVATRRRELSLLIEQVSHCDRCTELAISRTQTVFGVGPLDAEICFIGEAPGQDEDIQGEPFVGASGQLLNRIIIGCGLRREDIYICNILRCRPPGNRTPKPEEASNCREYLDRTLELVKPKIICCWGGVAAQNLLRTTTGITKLRGKFYEYRDTPVLCTFHPSALLRDPDKKKDVWEDMKLLLKTLGKPIPGTKQA
jgi:DNA polymerase